MLAMVGRAVVAGIILSSSVWGSSVIAAGSAAITGVVGASAATRGSASAAVVPIVVGSIPATIMGVSGASAATRGSVSTSSSQFDAGCVVVVTSGVNPPCASIGPAAQGVVPSPGKGETGSGSWGQSTAFAPATSILDRATSTSSIDGCSERRAALMRSKACHTGTVHADQDSFTLARLRYSLRSRRQPGRVRPSHNGAIL